MTTENDFVRQLARRTVVKAPVEVGIGDDGAVIRIPSSKTSNREWDEDQRIVVVTDMLLDGVHFDLNEISPSLAGRKAVAVNLSDLAAMACFPTAAFVSIAIPSTLRMPCAKFLDQLYSGIESLTSQFNFTLAGGDTNSWNGPFAINVCLTGSPVAGQPILRSGAMPGDHLFVTGPLGGSLRRGRHLTFEPRLQLAQWLVQNFRINAMMDLSDGLSMDLHRMMEASRTGAILHAEAIPIHEDVPDHLSPQQRLHAALADGEDFELLLTVSKDDSATLTRIARESGIAIHEIGKVTASPAVQIHEAFGQIHPLSVVGWEHKLE